MRNAAHRATAGLRISKAFLRRPTESRRAASPPDVAVASARAARIPVSTAVFTEAFYPRPDACARCLFRPCRRASVDAEDDSLSRRIGLRERVVAALARRQNRACTVGSAAQRP